MKPSLTILIVSLLLSGCYKSAYEGTPPTKSTLGTGVFQEANNTKTLRDYTPPERKITNGDVKLYMFEQQALFKARVNTHAIKTELDENLNLSLNIPGNISFSVNSASINWNMHAVLDKISSVLRAYPDTSITVIGHTDSRGEKEINEMLSKQRAMSIADYLIRTGVAESRIIYYGVADAEQLTSNDTTLNRSINRRVQIILTPMVPPEYIKPANNPEKNSTDQVAPDAEIYTTPEY